MTQRKFVTIRSDAFNEEIDLEMPGDEKIKTLLPDLLKVLNWPATADNKELTYQLRTEDRQLRPEDTLVGAGIENFQVVWITPPPEISVGVVQKPENATRNGGETAQEPRRPRLPFWQQVPIDRPSLVSPKGLVFVLGQPPILIGRKDANTPVNIDLTELEGQLFISSRRHAEILLENGTYCLRPLKTKNGTFINRVELQAGIPYPIKDLDIIQFGFRGVQLIFRLP